MRTRVSSSGWSPSHLAIQGEFCPIEEIAPAVELARRRAGASAALLLVGDDWVVLRTLCACTPSEDEHAAWLERILATESLLPPEAEGRGRYNSLQDYIRGPKPSGSRSRRFPCTAPKALAALAEIATRAGAEPVAAWLSDGSWVPARVPAPVIGARMHTALFMREPDPRLVEGADPGEVEIDDEVVGISARVNATAHAHLRRDDMIMKRVDKRLDPEEFMKGSVDFQAAARSLVGVALGISGSDVAACYLVDHSRKRFKLEDAKLVGELGSRWRFPLYLPTKDPALAAVATQDHLTLQFPPGLAKREVRRTLEGPEGEEVLELATPLPGPLAAPRAPAVGVLVVAKIGQPRAYGAYEVAVVRNVALRLALIASSTNTTQAAKMFTRLSKRAARLPIGWSTRASRAPMPPGVILPDDLLDAVPTIEDALSTLARVTRSGTATFRAALPGDGSRSPQGLTLARVAGYPAKIGRKEKFAFQPEGEGGYNWVAVRSGQITSIPIVDPSDPKYSSHRDSTRSELAVPVFVEDRVVGVVNLESPVEHAFDGHVEIAQAAAEHIGLAIANARLSLSGLVQERATDVLREAHRITKLPEDFEQELDRLPAAQRKRVAEAAGEIPRRAKGLALVAPFVPSLPGTDLSLPALTEHVIDEMSAGESFHLRRWKGPWRQYDQDVATAIVKALRDILENAQSHAEKDGRTAVLELMTAVWGGQKQDVLIAASWGSALKPERAINVYRCPLTVNSRSPRFKGSQLGAYLAGLQVRRVGGEVHLSYSDDGQARVVLSIPSPTQAWRRGRAASKSKSQGGA